MAFRKKSEISGRVGAAAGAVKEKLGRATENGSLEEQGVAERTSGTVEAEVGRAGRKIGNAVEHAGRKLNKL